MRVGFIAIAGLLNVLYGQSVDLSAGNTCNNWTIPLMISTSFEDSSGINLEENLIEGRYYINSSIQNSGSSDVIFEDNQSVWRIYLDGTEIQDYGWWTLERHLTPAPTSYSDAHLLRSRWDEYAYWIPSEIWVSRNTLSLQQLFQARDHNAINNLSLSNNSIRNDQSSLRSTILSEDFEAWPNTWYNVHYDNTVDGWEYTTSFSYSGNGSMICDSSLSIVRMQGLRSPLLDLSEYEGQNINLSFFQRADRIDDYVWHEVKVLVDGILDSQIELGSASMDWTMTELDLSSYAGMTGVQIEFYYQGWAGDTWFIDTVTLSSSGEIGSIHVISAGECLTEYANSDLYLSPGIHELRIVVDPDDLIVEEDENNNELTIMLSVLPQNQPQVVEWIHTYGNEEHQSLYGSAVDINGNNLAAGLWISDIGMTEAWLLQTNEDGELNWELVTPSAFSLLEVTPTSDGGAVWSGTTIDYTATMMKTDVDGNIEWNRIFETYDGHINSHILTPDNGYLGVGLADNNGWVVKTDANGIEQWNQSYAGIDLDGFMDVVPATDEGYLIVGWTGNWENGQYQGWVVKISEVGTELWNYDYGVIGGHDKFNSIQPSDDGGYIIVGRSADSSPGGNTDAWIVKIDSNGNIIWDYRYGGEGVDGFNSLAKCPEGGYLAAGGTASYNPNGYGDGFVLKIDENGIEQWREYIGFESGASFNDVSVISGGGYILTGSSRAPQPRNDNNGIMAKIVPDSGPFISLEAFELISPENSEQIGSLSPEFRWSSAGENTNNYSLGLASTLDQIQWIDIGTDTTYSYLPELEDNTQYYWQIVAQEQSGGTRVNEGGFHQFVINQGNDDPSVVALITPDSVMVLTLTPEMYWTPAFDADPNDILTYEMHWWGDGIEYDSVLTDTHAVVLPRALEDNSLYFWDVITMDQNGGISYSDEAFFWTNLFDEVPVGFALLSPENDETGLTSTPAFLWESAEDPDPLDWATYMLQISTDSSFSDIVYWTLTSADVGYEMTEGLPVDTEYWWKVIATDRDSLSTVSETFKFTIGYVSIAEDIALPNEYVLQQNYPNPFNPSTTLRYGLPEDASVLLIIYDIRGNVVKTIESGTQVAGWYEHTWNGLDESGQPVSTGLFLTRLQAGSYSKVIKMLYLK